MRFFLPLQISFSLIPIKFHRYSKVSIAFYQKFRRESIALVENCILVSCFDDKGSRSEAIIFSVRSLSNITEPLRCPVHTKIMYALNTI
jgi:hypothetical protein